MKTETRTVQICNMEFSIKKTTKTHMDGTKWYCIANAKNNTTIARFKLKRDCEFYYNNFEKIPILPI
jgi:hypothetical protein